jgi:hypothetical protein
MGIGMGCDGGWAELQVGVLVLELGMGCDGGGAELQVGALVLGTKSLRASGVENDDWSGGGFRNGGFAAAAARRALICAARSPSGLTARGSGRRGPLFWLFRAYAGESENERPKSGETAKCK